MNADTKIIILCAGIGSRLRPFTNHKPKSLVELFNKSLLARQIEVLENFNLDIFLVGGFQSNQLLKISKNLIINEEYQSTNMLWSLFKAEDILNGDLIISYGDIVYSPHLIKDLLKDNNQISIPVDLNWLEYWQTRQIDVLSDVETLEFNENNFLLDIGQKAKSIDDIQAQYMGLIKLNKEGCEIFKDHFNKYKKIKLINDISLREAYLSDFLYSLIKDSIPINVLPHRYNWVEIDTVSDLNSDENKKRILEIEEETLKYRFYP